MSRRVDVLIVGMKCIVHLGLQHATVANQFAPLLKSAWHRSASFRDGMGCLGGQLSLCFHSALETSASGIMWWKEIGQWNDLALKGIGNHKLDARNVQGPPTECLTVRSNSSWPKRIETWCLLVLQK